jgi:hypothetical protein
MMHRTDACSLPLSFFLCVSVVFCLSFFLYVLLQVLLKERMGVLQGPQAGLRREPA